MQDYLMRALEDDVDTLKLINVIRVITGKSILHQGKEMENKFIEPEDEEENEEVEIDDILSSYIKKG